MIPPGVDLEPHLALRRDLRRAGARARRQARAAPRFDLLAAMQNWTDPPRNRPPGLDPASQFLHDAFDGLAPGVAPLVPRVARPPSSDAMMAALESLHGCACKEGVKEGDACGQGGTVATDTDWEYIDGECHLTVPCENQACYNVAKVWTDNAVGGGENSACRRACEGKGGGGTITGFDCNLVDGWCDCTATCACVDGGTGSTEVNGLSPSGSQYSDLTDWDGLCPPTSEWTMPGSEGGWGEAPGGGGTAPDPGDLDWEPPGSAGSSEAGIGSGLLGLGNSAEAGETMWPFNGAVVNNYKDSVKYAYGGSQDGEVPSGATTPNELWNYIDVDFVLEPATGQWWWIRGQEGNFVAKVDGEGSVSGATCRVASKFVYRCDP